MATGIKRSAIEKAKRWWKRYNLPQIASRIGVRIVGKFGGGDARRQQAFRSVFFPEGESGLMPRRDILSWVPSHNGPECLELLAALKPDIVVVYGTLIIGRKVIAACPRIINIHTGYSPNYRGSDTVFWALHNADMDYMGVTVHRLDAGVDTGAILARGRPEMNVGDREATLWAKATRLGAELLCAAIRRDFAGTSKPIKQNLSLGREYRSVDRSIAAELKLHRMLSRGLIERGTPEWSEEF